MNPKIQKAIESMPMNLSPLAQTSRACAWWLHHIALVLGLLIFYFHPIYAICCTPVAVLLVALRESFHPSRLMAFDVGRLAPVDEENPIIHEQMVESCLGTIHYRWEMSLMPFPRKVADEVIGSPFSWPWQLVEIAKLSKLNRVEV